MTVFDPALRRITHLGVSVAGSLILEVHRRTKRELARANPRNIPRAIRAGWWRRPMRHGRDQTSTAHELLATRAWNRFLAAFDALDERRAAFLSSPSDLTAEQLRWAEVELEDAVAVAGEFQVHNLRWSLA
jgi:hypothetical protein